MSWRKMWYRIQIYIHDLVLLRFSLVSNETPYIASVRRGVCPFAASDRLSMREAAKQNLDMKSKSKNHED